MDYTELEDILGRFEMRYECVVTPRALLEDPDLLDRLCEATKYGPYGRDDYLAWAKHVLPV